MKLSFKSKVYLVVLGAFLALDLSGVPISIGYGVMGAIHPPNQRTECQRSGCGHPKSMHAKNGPCEYSDPFIVVGHCAGFER